MELRCEKDEHPLTVTKADPKKHGFQGVLIDGPQCTIGCHCCQRAGSLEFSVASIFRPGVLSGHDARGDDA